MTKKKKITIFAAILILLMGLAALSVFVATRMLDLETHRAELIQAVKTALNRDVHYAKGDFSLWFRPGFTFTGVVIKEKDAQATFITADRLSFKLAILPLLKKKVVLHEMALENPRIAIVREASGAFNVSDLLEDKKQDLSFKINRLRIRNGNLRFTDRWIAPEGLTTSLEQLNLHLDHFERGKNADFALSAIVVDTGKSGNLSLEGFLEISKDSESLLKSRIDTAVKAGGLNAGWYWPYYSRYVPFKKIFGRLDIDTRYRGNFTDFTSKGSMTIHDLHFDYPPIFHAPLKPKTVHAVYDMKLDPHDIAVSHLDVTVDGVNVKGSCLLKDIHTDDLLIDAKAVTTQIRWESFSHFVPYGVIPKDVADFIEQKIKGGIFRLDEGRLYGRVSQIAHMEKGDNYNVLYIRGRAEQAVLKYAPGVPDFNSIAGLLELKGKDFILHNMSGKFGDAPFSAEGKLADYCVETPTIYPFTMNMTPTAKEVAWLFSDEPVKKLRYTGKSTLHLSGNGTTTNYNLNGVWDLSATHYQYPEWLDKPAGKANHLSFKINMNKEEALFSAIQYNLSPLSLSASAKYRHAGKRGLSLAINTNPFQMQEIVPMLPTLGKFKPQGTIQASLRAESASKDLADLRWGGEIALTGASFKPAAQVQPLGNVTGKLRLQDDALETPQMDVQLGSSMISVQGTVANLKKPSLSLTFSSPGMDMADLGLHHPKQPVQLKNVSGSVVFKDRDLQINALTFHINDSILNIKGTVQNVQDRPRTDINVASPYLDWQDIMTLGKLKHTENIGQHPAKTTLKAAIYVDVGRMDKFNVRKLKTNLSLDENVLYLEALEFNALGGTVAGSSRIDLADIKAPRYQFTFKLNKLSAEQCLQLFDIKGKLITGTLSAQGDLTAKGGSSTDLKKTTLGHIRVQVEEGKLAGLSTLSKIFSILNVSQLFKLQLPDMVRGGMPYDKIIATLSFKDGIMSTKDLFIRSDAMNISAVASVDMLKKEFFQTVVGVQPLQTLDKTVGRIPVVGWILTDKNKGIITVYFEVKGNIDEPLVTAIPAEAMARGVFDIFKNIFLLPVKLFTDTGEVLFGR